MNVLMEMRDLLENNGSVFGKTKSGKPVHQFGAAGWQGEDDWTAQDHEDAEEMHLDGAVAAAYGKNPGHSYAFDSSYDPEPKHTRGHHKAAEYHSKKAKVLRSKSK